MKKNKKQLIILAAASLLALSVVGGCSKPTGQAHGTPTPPASSVTLTPTNEPGTKPSQTEEQTKPSEKVTEGSSSEQSGTEEGTPSETPSESAETPEPTETPIPALDTPTPAPVVNTPTPIPVGTDIQLKSGKMMSSLASVENKDIPFGYGTNDRDEQNRPNGCSYYKAVYGEYACDFIAPKEVGNTVYLTMDEGYEAGFTPTILDTLKAKNVKCVFFVTKQFVTEHPELVDRMLAEGHQLGNHTCAHPAAGMPSLGLEGQYKDVMWLHQYVLDKWGYEMKLFRYPSGTFSKQSLDLMQNMGYTCVFWSFAHNDWSTTNQPEQASALANTLNQAHPGAIYLLHAVSETNTKNMADFIDGIRAKGLEFGEYPREGFYPPGHE